MIRKVYLPVRPAKALLFLILGRAAADPLPAQETGTLKVKFDQVGRVTYSNSARFLKSSLNVQTRSASVGEITEIDWPAGWPRQPASIPHFQLQIGPVLAAADRALLSQCRQMAMVAQSRPQDYALEFSISLADSTKIVQPNANILRVNVEDEVALCTLIPR